MPVSRRAVLAALAACLPAAGCAPLTVIDTVIAKDGGSRLVAADIAYGPDPRHKLDLYAPAAAGGPTPVLVFVYGGSWNSGSKSDYSFVGRAFASRGYTVAVIDYRLVPAVVFPAFIEDAARALRWTHDHVAEHGGDPRRIHILGHSAGAYNVMMVTLDPRYLAGVGLSPRLLASAAGLAGPYDFLPLDVDATKAAFGSAPNLPATQPIAFARRDAPPIFLATGDADDTVFPRNTRALADRLRRAGAHPVEKTYPGVGHPGILLSIALPFRHKAPVLDDLDAFMAGRRPA